MTFPIYLENALQPDAHMPKTPFRIGENIDFLLIYLVYDQLIYIYVLPTLYQNHNAFPVKPCPTYARSVENPKVYPAMMTLEGRDYSFPVGNRLVVVVQRSYSPPTGTIVTFFSLH